MSPARKTSHQIVNVGFWSEKHYVGTKLVVILKALFNNVSTFKNLSCISVFDKV